MADKMMTICSATSISDSCGYLVGSKSPVKHGGLFYGNWKANSPPKNTKSSAKLPVKSAEPPVVDTFQRQHTRMQRDDRC